MADVFISYSSRDKRAAQQVQEALVARGIDVFWDQQTPVGQDWDSWIRGKLSTCKVAVVLWSKSSIQSPNVRHEAMVARDAGKLVPAMIETLQPADFPMGLYLVQSIHLNDWINSSSTGMARLVAEVEARLGSKGISLPPPKPASNPAPVIVGAAVLAVITGAAWWFTRDVPDALPAGPVEAATVSELVTCPDGSPPVFGVCPSDPGIPQAATPPAPALGPTQDALSRRMQGHWRWSDQMACADGPSVTLESGQLVFTTAGERFLHEILYDSVTETRTRVVGSPSGVINEQYTLTPEFVATSEVRNFNLVVANTSKGSRDTWMPCELN